MKRLLSLLMMICVLSTGFAWAAPSQPVLTSVRATHRRAHRHHAHKAGKHRAPRRHRHTV